MQKHEFITIVVFVVIFAAVFIGWHYSPFYLEKKAIEREKAIEWLVYNDPNNSLVFSGLHSTDVKNFMERRQYIIDKYNIKENEIALKFYTEKSTKQKLLDKNPVVKFLLGLE